MVTEAENPQDTERQLAVIRYLRASTRAVEQMALLFEREPLLERVAAILVEDFDAALARIWLYAPETGQLCLKASAGDTSPEREAAQPPRDVATDPYPTGEA